MEEEGKPTPEDAEEFRFPSQESSETNVANNSNETVAETENLDLKVTKPYCTFDANTPEELKVRLAQGLTYEEGVAFSKILDIHRPGIDQITRAEDKLVVPKLQFHGASLDAGNSGKRVGIPFMSFGQDIVLPNLIKEGYKIRSEDDVNNYAYSLLRNGLVAGPFLKKSHELLPESSHISHTLEQYSKIPKRFNGLLENISVAQISDFQDPDTSGVDSINNKYRPDGFTSVNKPLTFNQPVDTLFNLEIAVDMEKISPKRIGFIDAGGSSEGVINIKNRIAPRYFAGLIIGMPIQDLFSEPLAEELSNYPELVDILSGIREELAEIASLDDSDPTNKKLFMDKYLNVRSEFYASIVDLIKGDDVYKDLRPYLSPVETGFVRSDNTVFADKVIDIYKALSQKVHEDSGREDYLPLYTVNGDLLWPLKLPHNLISEYEVNHNSEDLTDMRADAVTETELPSV